MTTQQIRINKEEHAIMEDLTINEINRVLNHDETPDFSGGCEYEHSHHELENLIYKFEMYKKLVIKFSKRNLNSNHNYEKIISTLKFNIKTMQKWIECDMAVPDGEVRIRTKKEIHNTCFG